ncbi:hypothetical protein Cme02nite_60740 [Catellatospora methionotrophica]|uniref:Peptidase MA superfamily n=1 Tax=Catellatospora methionotrophica TaxID=121620 RepID=A0A8J3LB82_9ACTN|nr:hypothetical protein [Catellatospora methionotrophica]GIG17742.1 hypothetical protein Cme02nite_60740 [Catellatospora methionotrophica]
MNDEDAAPSADGSSIPPAPAPAVRIQPFPAVPAQRSAPDAPVEQPGPVVQAEQPAPGAMPVPGTQPVPNVPYPYPTLWPDPAVLHRPRRRWGLVVALVAGGLTLVCGAVGGLAVVVVPPVLEQLAEAGTDTPGTAPSPRPGDPVSVRQAWVKERIDKALAVQNKALIAGDEQGYLSMVDPTATSALDGLRIQFRSLRAMKVASWTDRGYQPSPTGDEWTVRLNSTPCFVVASCSESRTPSVMRWRVEGDKAVMVGWEPGDKNGGPPWQTDELVALAGARTVVATTPVYERQLPLLLREAEKAAKVADKYAVGSPPVRYPVYYADSREWERWFGGKLPDWAGGYAYAVTNDRYELVLNGDYLLQGGMGDMMRHELTHASSLAGSTGGYGAWWLVEGLAEEAAMNGAKPAAYPSLDEVRTFAKTWKGDLSVVAPGRTTAQGAVAGSYGVAYLAVHRLIARFGFAKAMAFFKSVLHQSREAALAAPAVLGLSWTVVQRDLVDYVRRTSR